MRDSCRHCHVRIATSQPERHLSDRVDDHRTKRDAAQTGQTATPALRHAFHDPKLAETGRNTIFLRLHDDMCFNCYAPTIRELYKLEEQFDISLQAAGAYHYDATFRQTLRDLEWRDRAAGNGMPPREALPADEAMIPYLFTLGPDGQIDALLFLSKQIPVETVSAFFGAAVRRFAE